MTCQELTEFLDDYLDGSLDVAVRQRFDFHLTICSDCRRYLVSYQKTVALGRGLGQPADETGQAKPPPTDAEPLIHAILASRPRSKSTL